MIVKLMVISTSLRNLVIHDASVIRKSMTGTYLHDRNYQSSVNNKLTQGSWSFVAKNIRTLTFNKKNGHEKEKYK